MSLRRPRSPQLGARSGERGPALPAFSARLGRRRAPLGRVDDRVDDRVDGPEPLGALESERRDAFEGRVEASDPVFDGAPRRRDPAPSRGGPDDRVGDPAVDATLLLGMSPLSAARHVAGLLARGPAGASRAERLAAVGELLIGLEHPVRIRRIFVDLSDVGRIVDLYPLEVLAYVLERRPDLMPGTTFGEVVFDAPALERTRFRVDETIRLAVPLALRVRGFAVEGGRAPGYALQPGPPGEYHLALGEPGRSALLFLGLIRGQQRVQRLCLEIVGEGGAETEPRVV